MKQSHLGAAVLASCLFAFSCPMAFGQAEVKGEKKVDKKDEKEAVYPVAILTFEDRGTKEVAAKVADLLFAKLVAKPDFYLVDRADFKKLLDEQSLSLSGTVKADEAVKVGQLTGAKVLITGTAIQVEKKLFLVAKLIGTENGRVLGASVEGQTTDDLGALAGKLADALEKAMEKNREKLVSAPVKAVDRIAELKKKLGDAKLPDVMIQVTEKHIGQPAVDPAAQTEIMRFAKAAGFELIDAEEGAKSKADVLITGEGFSEIAGKVGNLISVRARVELKAVDRKTGKVLAVDRQTTLVVDVSEQIAGKTALQQAGGELAERLLAKLAPAEKK